MVVDHMVGIELCGSDEQATENCKTGFKSIAGRAHSKRLNACDHGKVIFVEVALKPV